MLSWLWRKWMRGWVKPILLSIWNRLPSWLEPWLTPVKPAEEMRPTASDYKGHDRDDAGDYQGRYIRSFLYVRLAIGCIGLALPFVLWLGDWWVFSGDPHPRNSESVYYYSGMREVFTGSVGSVALFLFIYRISERSLDNTLSMIAGLAGMMIPFFPTHRPDALAARFPDTDLQKLFHNHGWTAYVHYSATAVFITGLGGIIILFGQREGKRVLRNTKLKPHEWRRYHYWCARLIALAAVWIVVTNWLWKGSPRISMLLGEGLATAAFGASWFAKGAEIKYLLTGEDKEPVLNPEPEAVEIPT